MKSLSLMLPKKAFQREEVTQPKRSLTVSLWLESLGLGISRRHLEANFRGRELVSWCFEPRGREGIKNEGVQNGRQKCFHELTGLWQTDVYDECDHERATSEAVWEWAWCCQFSCILRQLFYAACRRLICAWGQPARRLIQKSSFDRINETAVLSAALRVRYERSLLKHLTWKKQDLTTAKTYWSKERAASKLIPRVVNTLENGMDAPPNKRLLTGTLSLLEGGPQRGTSVFCSLRFNLFSSTIFLNLPTTRISIAYRFQRRLIFRRYA